LDGPEAGEARSLLAGLAGYEDPATAPAAVVQFNMAAGAPQRRALLPSGTAVELPCIGPLAIADIDGDGRLTFSWEDA